MIVVIAILAAISVVAYNGIADKARNAAMEADIAQWKTKAELHKIDVGITCPTGYVFVYGNPALGTSDFCVMKYEAKNDGSGNAVSTATGTPWVNISQTAAISTATAACAGCHLITEAEWMTIAADVLSVKYNWSGGAVGSGYVYSGHSTSTPANALDASTDDNDGYFGETNAGGNQRRTLILTSGDTIWDLAGNVWEWTQGVISGAQPGLSTDDANGSIYSWKEWNAVGMNWNLLPAGSQTSAIVSTPGLSAVSGWNSTNGIGQLYSNQNQTGLRAFRRGGYWADSPSAAGILSLTLSGAPSNFLVYIGFRVSR